MARLIRGRRWGVTERWKEIMHSLPSGSWIDDLDFAEAACKRITELEEALGELLQACIEDFGDPDEEVELGMSPDGSPEFGVFPDDEPVASPPCAVLFGHLRRAKQALAKEVGRD
jgi:hypothetical protein